MRRAAGSGSLTHRGGDRWLVRLVTADGRRRTRTIRAVDREAAQARLDALVGLLASEGMASPGGVTVRGWLGEWLERRARSRSWAAYDSRIRSYLHKAPFVDDLLVNVRPRDVRDFVRQLLADFEPTTTRGALAVLKMAFREAVEDEIVGTNPAAEVRMPRSATQGPERRAPLTRDEVDQVLASDLSTVDRAILTVALFCGLRSGELFAMPLANVVESAGRLLLRVEFGGFGGAPTKSGKTRDVPVTGPARPALEAWLAKVPKHRVRNNDLLLFPGRMGGRRDLAHASGWLRLRLAAAGVKARPRFHDLRHTAAQALENGWFGPVVPREHVQALLGHATIAQTEHYTGGSHEAMLRSMDGLNAALSKDQRRISNLPAPHEIAVKQARTARSARRTPWSAESRESPDGSGSPDPSLILRETEALYGAIADGSVTQRQVEEWRQFVLDAMPDPWRSVLGLDTTGPLARRRALEAMKLVVQALTTPARRTADGERR